MHVCRRAARPSVAAIFPMMVDADLVAFAVMLISLCGGDGAQSNDGGGKGEDNFLHYKILNSSGGAIVAARRVPQRVVSMPHRARRAYERQMNPSVNEERRRPQSDGCCPSQRNDAT